MALSATMPVMPVVAACRSTGYAPLLIGPNSGLWPHRTGKADIACRTTAEMSPSVTRRPAGLADAQQRYDGVIGNFPL
jgi:hypothetical protein